MDTGLTKLFRISNAGEILQSVDGRSTESRSQSGAKRISRTAGPNSANAAPTVVCIQAIASSSREWTDTLRRAVDWQSHQKFEQPHPRKLRTHRLRLPPGGQDWFGQRFDGSGGNAISV